MLHYLVLIKSGFKLITNEPLDYCRVKKLSDKGFGFLTSLYYNESIFFHFNKVKDADAKEKLQNFKRGEVYFYFTSKLNNGKRKVDSLWLDISDVNKQLLPKFVSRIIQEFDAGKTNPYEVAYVIRELRKNKFINREDFTKIVDSSRLLKLPAILKSFLYDEEKHRLSDLENLITKFENREIDENSWKISVISEFFNDQTRH